MSFSQDDQDYSNGNQYVISRYDGGEYIGEIISDDGKFIITIGGPSISENQDLSIKIKMGKYPTMKITNYWTILQGIILQQRIAIEK